jgi:hypothetical protein
MSNYLLEAGIAKLSERIDIVTDKNDQFRNYIDNKTRKLNLETNISWVIAKMTLAFNFQNEYNVSHFKEFINRYNSENKTHFQFESIIEKGWIRQIIDSIEFPSQVSHFFRKLEMKEPLNLLDDYEKLLKMLYQFKISLEPIEKISISTFKLLELLNDSEIQLLIGQEILSPKSKDEFYVTPNDCFNFLKNEICASLWILLSSKISDDVKRLKTFVNSIIHFGIYWPDKLSDFFNNQELSLLQAESMKILMQEKDLKNEGFEFNKLWLDSKMNSHIDLSSEIPLVKISGENPFLLLSNISDLKKQYYWIYEDPDSVRIKYGLLLNIILQTVKNNFHSKENIRVIFDLVNEVNRPYLVFHSSWIIKKYYQHLLPYYLLDLKTALFPFFFLNDIEIKENATNKKATDPSFERKKDNELKTEIFKSMFDLLLDKLASHVEFTEVGSEVIYLLFKYQANRFYNNPSYTNQDNHIEESSRFDYLLKSLSERRVLGYFEGATKPRFFTKYLNNFIKRLLIDPIQDDSNKYIGFNCAKFELTYQILSISRSNFTKNELSTEEKDLLEINTNKLITNWKDLYLDYFTNDEVETFNIETNKNEIHTIRRISDPSGIEILNWGHFWAFVNESGSLEETLKTIHSTLSFDNTESQDYSNINLETKAKLKFFMKSVALGLIAIKRDKSQFTFLFGGIDSLLKQLALALWKYTIQHCLNDLSKQRIFVFDETTSSLNNDIYFEPTIKLVFIALNLMEDSLLVKFHKSILENDLDLLFLLTILNLSNSEEVIELITEKIQNIDSSYFINNVRHADQWKNAIIESLNSSSHFEIAEPIISKLETWASKSSTLRINYSNFIFRTKLMLAFKRKDLVGITQIECPDGGYISESPINNLEELRRYFLALHWGYNENEFDKAITIFNELIAQNPNDIDSRYHIFHLETQKNIDIGNSEELFRSKLIWDQFTEQATKDQQDKLKSIQPNINFTLLFHHCHLREYENVDRIIQSLPDTFKYDQKIIYLVFQSYLQRELSINAISYLTKAEHYQTNNDVQIHDLIQSLRDTVDNTKHISDLSNAYSQIYSIPFKELPRVVPKSLNGKSNIQEFVFQEIIQASFILLEKIISISQITWENKYNDLLLTALRLRFAVWNWSITDQPRAGESKSGGGDLGSLDFLISSAGKSIALIEAMILESGNMSKTEEHITKCFTYLAQSKVHYVVVYFKGPKENFESSWSAYKTNVLTIDYKDDQMLRKNEFTDTSEELEKNNIKAGITHHVNGVDIYHVYINVSSS